MSHRLRSHSRQPNQSPQHHQLLTLWPRRRFVITLLHLLPRSLPDLRSTLEEKISRLRRVLSRWCRPALSVARPMRMPALISSSSWSSAVLLLSRVYRKMQSGSVCFRSLSWGERNSGFMLTRLLWILGTNVPRCSSRSSSRRAKPILFVDRFRTFSRHQMSQFLKLGRDFRSTFWHVRTTEWIIVSFYRTSTTGPLKELHH